MFTSLRFTLGVAAISLLLSGQPQAQTVMVGTGIFCDTQKQMEEFVAYFDGDEETAVNAVNEVENDPTACVHSTVAYVRGPEIETARNKSGDYRIVKVVIVGLLTESGLRSAVPVASFSVERVDERVA